MTCRMLMTDCLQIDGVVQVPGQKYTAAHFLAKALLYRQSERCSDWNSSYPADADLNKSYCTM